MGKSVVNHAFWVFVIVMLEAMTTIMAMNNMFYTFAESAQSNSAVMLYLLLGVLGGIFVLFYCRNVFASKYVLSLLLFLCYFLLNSLFVASGGYNRILNNCTWVVIAIIGFAIGYKNADLKAVNRISSWVIAVSLPLLCLLVFLYSWQDVGGALVSKDAFFILTFVLPWGFLMKKNKWQMVILLIFLLLGILSMKRTIIIVMVLSIAVWANWLLKESNVGLFKRLLIGIICFVFLLSWGKNSLVGEMIYGRFADLGTDGGSGRDIIYGRVFNDMSNYNFIDIILGKGRDSVTRLLGVDAHMDLLQIAHSLGLIGLGIYLLIYYRCLRLGTKYSQVKNANKQLYHAAFLTFSIFVVMANLNCFIFNPPFVTPMMFVLSFQMGVLQRRLEIKKCDYVLYCRNSD